MKETLCQSPQKQHARGSDLCPVLCPFAYFPFYFISHLMRWHARLNLALRPTTLPSQSGRRNPRPQQVAQGEKWFQANRPPMIAAALLGSVILTPARGRTPQYARTTICR